MNNCVGSDAPGSTVAGLGRNNFELNAVEYELGVDCVKTERVHQEEGFEVIFENVKVVNSG